METETLPEGQTDLEALAARDPNVQRNFYAIERAHKEQKSKMSPPGTLGLPALLEERRLHYGLPDGVFDNTFGFDNVAVFQIMEKKARPGFFGDTNIHQPDASIDKERMFAPRGIIVSAGLRALDELRSNGMDLGHIVLFSRLVPFRYVCDYVNGKPIEIVLLTTGDIRASEDLTKKIRDGSVTYDVVDGQHVYRNEKGAVLTPVPPWKGEDF